MNNVILIGMPGCGKSTIGVIVAKRLGYRFVDTDLLIQEKENKRLFEILRDNGNDYFVETENKVVSALKAEKTVIATGGSVVFGKEAMQNLKRLGRVVYLRVPLCEIEKRVNNLETRGVLMNDGQTLADIFTERTPLYEMYADLTVDATLSLAENAIEIEQALEQK